MTNTIVFAHRGLPVKFAENSLEGFRYAVTHGAEGVECDVHLTKDKVPVVMHDEEIDLEFKTNKVHDVGIEGIVLALAKKYHFVHPIIFSSFNYQTLKNCQRIDLHQQYCFLTKMPVALPERFVKKNHFAAIHPHFYLPSKVTQRIWTVDNPRIAKRYFKLGVAGIFTNNFELMNKVKEKSR